ncbi:MAG: molybdopterin-synthase adenylyltransferase MoeB [Gemmatimonadales bacterium]
MTDARPADLTPPELLRYSRHLVLPEVGLAGQRKLKAARVLLIGAGGLGSPAALYLAAAGIGVIGIVEFDTLDATNLQRQVLHGTSWIGKPKLDSAVARLRELNPHVAVEPIAERLTSANARGIIRRYDIVLDGSDNFPTRYLVNDACVLEGKPLVYGSIFRFEGQVSLFHPPAGPCYRCLFSEPPPPGLVPNCAEGGVLGVLPGIIGSLQALEALKWILGVGTPALGRLLLFDALKLEFRELAITRDLACPVCGEHPSITDLIDYEAFCGLTASETDQGVEISVAELRRTEVGKDAPLVLDVRELWEWELVHLRGAVHVPLSELPARLGELDTRREIVTLCHHGMRSLSARELLRGAGFARVRSLAGGIDAWALEVGQGMVRY